MVHSQRLQKLQALLNDDTLLVEKEIDLFYLTGLQLSAGSLLISSKEAFLLVDNRYFELCRKNSPVPVFLMDGKRFPEKIIFDAAATSYARFQELQNSGILLEPGASLVARLRMCKEPNEILALTEAATLGVKGFEYVCSLLKEGITESSLALQLEIFWKQKGAKSLAFSPIIAFGSNSAMPHYRSGNVALKRGMTILIDIGVNLNHYCSDMTRVYFFGEPDPEIREIYAIVAESQKRALALCKPGALIGAIDKAARDFIAEKGYGDYFGHGLGHGVGLEVHEQPPINQKSPFAQMALQEGMVITIEPGIYLPDRGGVRLEDTVIITEKYHKNITNIPI